MKQSLVYESHPLIHTAVIVVALLECLIPKFVILATHGADVNRKGGVTFYEKMHILHIS